MMSTGAKSAMQEVACAAGATTMRVTTIGSRNVARQAQRLGEPSAEEVLPERAARPHMLTPLRPRKTSSSANFRRTTRDTRLIPTTPFGHTESPTQSWPMAGSFLVRGALSPTRTSTSRRVGVLVKKAKARAGLQPGAWSMPEAEISLLRLQIAIPTTRGAGLRTGRANEVRSLSFWSSVWTCRTSAGSTASAAHRGAKTGGSCLGATLTAPPFGWPRCQVTTGSSTSWLGWTSSQSVASSLPRCECTTAFSALGPPRSEPRTASTFLCVTSWFSGGCHCCPRPLHRGTTSSRSLERHAKRCSKC
mmetsp:Transcript_29085/g.67655  ORF Transcript_29085/g.67655 Transcript_29085/m.67655 type:complete len:305 (-) Transcript_29085:557-1471(-)